MRETSSPKVDSNVNKDYIIEGIRDIASLNARKGIKIMHWNVRSMIHKFDQFRSLLADSNIDVITISESWLQPHLHS